MISVALALAIHLFTATTAPQGQSPLRRRFTLVVGANDGGASKKLRHAVSDAQAFARVMTLLGGVRPEDQMVLVDPEVVTLQDALQKISTTLSALRDTPTQSEFIFYYSGHSDSEGLLLKGEHFSYSALHQSLESVGSNFRIAVLDSCQSGFFTRNKGGTAVAPFLVDGSSHVSGNAVITSSSATEASQESDKIGASFFSHNLISGLRGAADVSRDGKVTLAEAYQFAFHETLAVTEKTLAGTQHPAYEMAVAGSGDVVLTDLRSSSAVLELPASSQGRFFFRDQEQRLVAELGKRQGASVDIGLEPGKYFVAMVRDGKWSATTIELQSGARTTLDIATLSPIASAPYPVRGDEVTVETQPSASTPRSKSFLSDFAMQLATGLTAGKWSVGMGSTPRFSFYPSRLRDDSAVPLGLLTFLQHPTTVSFTFSPSAIANGGFDFGVAGTTFPWERTGLEGSITVNIPNLFRNSPNASGSSVGLDYSIGVIHYFKPTFSLAATYLGHKGMTGGWSPLLGSVGSDTTTHEGAVRATFLARDKLLINVSVLAGVSQFFQRIAETNQPQAFHTYNNLHASITSAETLYLTRRLGLTMSLGAGIRYEDFRQPPRTTTAFLWGGPSVTWYANDWLSLNAGYVLTGSFGWGSSSFHHAFSGGFGLRL